MTWDDLKKVSYSKVETVGVFRIEQAMRHLLVEYNKVLISVCSCRLEVTLLEKYHLLNEMDNNATCLLKYAKSIATSKKEWALIEKMEAKCYEYMEEKREAIILKK